MISSAPLAWTLTALFTLTGCYALIRWSTAVSAGRPAAHRTAELAHLVMSVAMVVMTWTWFGTTGLTVQIALFAVFGGFFVVTAVRGIHCGYPGRLAGAAHALMAAAMVWMLAAMPLIMPVAVSASDGGHGAHGGHEGHGGSGGADHAMHAGQAGWAVAVTVVLCGVLLVAAGFWAVRAVSGGGRAGDPFAPDDPGTGAAAATGSGEPSGSGGLAPGTQDADDASTRIAHTGAARASGAAATALAEEPVPAEGRAAPAGPAHGRTDPAADPAGAPVAPADRPVAPAAPRLGAREDAGCHAIMSLGMVLMLAAMVAGW